MMGTVCSHYVIPKYGTQEYRFTHEEYARTLETHFRGLSWLRSYYVMATGLEDAAACCSSAW